MEPYRLVRNIVEGGYEDPVSLYYVVKLITSTVSPFVPMQDGSTIFEIAVKKKRAPYVYMFVSHWALCPNWNMHDEIYKLEAMGELGTLREIEGYVLRHKDSSAIVNHLLNILQLSLARL